MWNLRRSNDQKRVMETWRPLCAAAASSGAPTRTGGARANRPRHVPAVRGASSGRPEGRRPSNAVETKSVYKKLRPDNPSGHLRDSVRARRTTGGNCRGGTRAGGVGSVEYRAGGLRAELRVSRASCRAPCASLVRARAW